MTRRTRALLAAGLALWLALSTNAEAIELKLRGDVSLERSTPPVSTLHPIATGPWSAGLVPTTQAQGLVREFYWHIRGEGVSAEQIAGDLTRQLREQGFEITFACEAERCGGFDFRHALPLGDPPEMFIDLGAYHYIAARSSGDEGTIEAALTVSQGGQTSFLHLALIRPGMQHDEQETDTTSVSDLVVTQAASSDLGRALLQSGMAALDDLVFETGASTLSGERYPSLVALAEFLSEDADRVVYLVGHTDASGSLEANMTVSRNRAEAVRRFLIEDLDVRPGQVSATGIGFLSPRATNLTEEGRNTNRRVEVVLVEAG